MIKYNCNVCDRIYNEVIIHFTKDCPNNCAFCIDKRNIGIDSRKPNIDKIYKSLETCLEYIDTVTISGGEPFIYMDELYDLIKKIKTNTNLKIIVVTALPKECLDNKEKFYEICEMCDNIQISGQHYDNEKAYQIMNIRFNSKKYDRHSLIKEFPFKDKTTISLNVIKYLFDNKEDILDNILHFNKLGYKDIKIAEMFDCDKYYVSIPDVLGIKMKSPFAHGCKTIYDTKKLIPEFNGTLTIKRTCFLRTNCQKASLSDCFKMLTKYIQKKDYFFGVIHEDGTIAPYWI